MKNAAAKTVSSTCHFHWLGLGPITEAQLEDKHTQAESEKGEKREKGVRMKVIFTGWTQLHQGQGQRRQTYAHNKQREVREKAGVKSNLA